MERTPASPESIEILINNSKRSIRDYERLLDKVEKAKTILGIFPDDNKPDLDILHLTLEILSGGIAGLHECIIASCRLLRTNSLYEKRYQMRNINLCQFEWCKYMLGRDNNGVFAQYCNLFSKCNDAATVSYLNDIRNKIRKLGAKCNSNLRNITVHYDNPSRIYKELIRLNDEDEYMHRIGDQMEIWDKIMVFIDSFLDILNHHMPFDKHCESPESASDLNIQSLANENISAEFARREELQTAVKVQLATAWEKTESINQNHYKCEKAIAFFRQRKIDFLPLQNILSLLEFGWAVSFMRSDLACAISSYLNSYTVIDGSVCLRHIYMTETAALTHLYGYDDEHRKKSIWHKIKMIAEFASVSASKQIEQRLTEFTDTLDCNRRNLYTHYRENGFSNISKRWNDFQEMDHAKELYRLLKLLNLCNDIYSYTNSLLSAINITQEKKSAEAKGRYTNMISEIKSIGIKTNNQEIIDASERFQNIINKF